MIGIILAVVLTAALIVGWNKGAIKQIGSIAAVVLAVFAARILGPSAEGIVGNLMGVDDPGQSSWSDYSVTIVAYAGVFAITWGVIWGMTRMLRTAIHLVHLGIVDRIAGAAFLAAKWMLVASIAVNIMMIVQPDAAMLKASQGWQGALLAGVADFAPWLWGAIAPQLNLPPASGVLS